MVISGEGNLGLATFTGNGTTGPFSYSEPYNQASELVVTVNGITKTLTVDYAVASTGTQDGHNTGANITFTVAPAVDAAIRVTRRTVAQQTLDFSSLNTFDPNAIEPILDTHALMVQDAKQKADEVVTLGVEEVVSAATPLTVAAATPLVEANVQPLVDEAETYKDAAAASAAAALVSENNAAADALLTAADVVSTNADVVSTNADVVTTNANVAAAQLAETNAETAETNAEAAQTASEAARDKAQEWATKAEDDPVETGPDQFSALHWAQKAEEQKDALIGTLTGDLLSWTTQTGSGSPSKGARLRVDSSDDSTIISLASTPDGDTEYNFTEADNVNWSVNPWTINPNGNNINGVAGNFTVAGRNPFRIIWKGATDGYEIEYLLQADGRFADTTGNFTAYNGGKYLIDEGATITLNSVVAGMEIYFQPKADQDLLSTPATISYNGVNTFFGFAEDYVFDDNGTIKLYSDDGTTIQVELTGVSHQNA